MARCRLGLRYIKHDRQAEEEEEVPELELGPSKGELGAPCASTQAAKLPQGALSSARLLLRFSPPHAHGHWEQADGATQAQLRRCYQGALLQWVSWLGRQLLHALFLLRACSACHNPHKPRPALLLPVPLQGSVAAS
jgi:hypothetical protein